MNFKPINTRIFVLYRIFTQKQVLLFDKMNRNTVLNIPLVKKNRNTVLKYSDSFIPIPICFLITPICLNLIVFGM